MQFKIKARNREIIIEEKRTSSVGQNYRKIEAKYKFKLHIFVLGIFALLFAAFVILGIMVLCGI